MAFGGGGSGKVRSEINVTPLVDVVLVLLIIFIVATPVRLHDISIEIPKKVESQTPDEMAAAPLIVSLTKEGSLSILDGVGTTEVNRVDLAAKLFEKLKNKRERERVVFVDFEDGVIYGEAVSIMDTCRGAGASTVALKMRDDTQSGEAPPSQ